MSTTNDNTGTDQDQDHSSEEIRARIIEGLEEADAAFVFTFSDIDPEEGSVNASVAKFLDDDLRENLGDQDAAMLAMHMTQFVMEHAGAGGMPPALAAMLSGMGGGGAGGATMATGTEDDNSKDPDPMFS